MSIVLVITDGRLNDLKASVLEVSIPPFMGESFEEKPIGIELKVYCTLQTLP